jgi:hypothetical protein
MKLRLKIVLCLVVLAGFTVLGCSNEASRVAEVKSYPITDTRAVLTRSGVVFDEDVTADGNGSLRVTAEQPTTYRLYETGEVEWTHQETPFFLKKGENPDNVQLNLVVNGSGTVWIDDIKLMRGPL